MGTPDAIEATPDLTISQAAERWGVSSANTVKTRAAALGVELRRESSTRTVWPAEHVALGDRLAEHLKRPGATLRYFPEALPSVPAASTRSDGVSQTATLTHGDGATAKAPLIGWSAPGQSSPGPRCLGGGGCRQPRT